MVLNVALHAKKYLALNDWFNTPQGARVAKACADEIACFNLQLRGERLLQLGLCGENPWLASLNYSQKIIASPCINQKKTAIFTLINQLPIDRDSIDCIIAPFIIEAQESNKNLLDELDRVLKPMGYIIFFGVNPISFWGLALQSRFLSLFGDAHAKLSSSFSVKNAVIDRGYRQCALDTFYYIPPVASKRLIHELEFLNEMGKMLWVFPAGFYCLVVQKYQVIPPSLTIKALEDNYLGCVDNSLA